MTNSQMHRGSKLRLDMLYGLQSTPLPRMICEALVCQLWACVLARVKLHSFDGAIRDPTPGNTFGAWGTST
jgi:hypothetical protein